MVRLFVFLALWISTSANAVTVYEMTNGMLTRITEVEVNGVLYDVSFQDGSFDSIYGDPASLTFSSNTDAFAAANALLSMMGESIVGSDGVTYDFEHGNWLVNGCANYVYCDMLTTYDLFTNTLGNEYAASVYARNFNDLYATPGTDSDFSMTSSLLRTADTAPWATYAVWTHSVSVPEASSLVLLGAGLLGVGFSRRRRQ